MKTTGEFTFEIIDRRDITLVRPLWEKLRLHHRSLSPHFRQYYESFTFEKRMEKLGDPALKLRLEAVRTGGTMIAYCISSIDGSEEGEIDSVYVEESFRGKGIGERLVENACRWLDENGITVKKVVVMYGNDEALPFYRKYGFYPAHYLLKSKE